MARSYDELFAEQVEPSLTDEDRRLRAVLEEDFSFGSQLAARRKDLGLTQAEVAARAGMTQADISRLERGVGNPTDATLERVASALEMRVRRVLVPR